MHDAYKHEYSDLQLNHMQRVHFMWKTLLNRMPNCTHVVATAHKVQLPYNSMFQLLFESWFNFAWEDSVFMF